MFYIPLFFQDFLCLLDVDFFLIILCKFFWNTQKSQILFLHLNVKIILIFISIHSLIHSRDLVYLYYIRV